MIEALAAAFWVKVRQDLVRGDEETRLWLDTGYEVGGFLWWCDFSNLDSKMLRRRMLSCWTPSVPTTEKNCESSASS